MSEKRTAFYYREHYYLLPHEYSSLEELKSEITVPSHIRLQSLCEDNHVRTNIEKGICIAPYFYSEYGYPAEDVLIEDLSDIFPVEVELFTQAEYNEHIRKVILGYCPGCYRYKPISNRVQSLNGHFGEISLNSVCFFRQNSKPAPRVFRMNLFGLGGFWKHFDPCGEDANRILDSIKSMIYLQFDSAQKDAQDPRNMTVVFKPDFFINVLAETLRNYIEKALPFTDFRMRFVPQAPVSKDEFEKQISEANRDILRKNCKRYGVSLAKLSFDPAFEEKVVQSLKPLQDHFYTVQLLNEPEVMNLLLLDECRFLKELHFRAPLFEPAKAEVTIYNQYNECRYSVSFGMEKHIGIGKANATTMNGHRE